MTTNKLFLLGGHDLEMKIISELLTEYGHRFADHVLQWHNARLSSYQEELLQYGDKTEWILYGIELQEDITPPANYICIDHHTQHSHKASALEQVATLLGHTLTHYQRLAAINDVLYIPGLYAAGATDSEVAHIRLADRQAQGVTEQDEALAIRSIRDHKTIQGELVTVRALTPRFSPICDRLYPCAKLLVYTDRELTYYGEGRDKLVALFQPYIHAKRIYYGGGAHGYLGAARGAFSSQEILQLVETIKTTLQ